MIVLMIVVVLLTRNGRIEYATGGFHRAERAADDMETVLYNIQVYSHRAKLCEEIIERQNHTT
jgi:hypothetical protein